MSRASGSTSGNNRFPRGAFILIALAIWLGVALIVGMGRTVFFVGVAILGGGYLLLRLVHAVERLAGATELLVERQE